MTSKATSKSSVVVFGLVGTFVVTGLFLRCRETAQFYSEGWPRPDDDRNLEDIGRFVGSCSPTTTTGEALLHLSFAPLIREFSGWMEIHDIHDKERGGTLLYRGPFRREVKLSSPCETLKLVFSLETTHHRYSVSSTGPVVLPRCGELDVRFELENGTLTASHRARVRPATCRAGSDEALAE